MDILLSSGRNTHQSYYVCINVCTVYTIHSKYTLYSKCMYIKCAYCKCVRVVNVCVVNVVDSLLSGRCMHPNHLIRSEIPILLHQLWWWAENVPTVVVGRKGTDTGGSVLFKGEKVYARGASLPALLARLCTPLTPHLPTCVKNETLQPSPPPPGPPRGSIPPPSLNEPLWAPFSLSLLDLPV